MTNYITVSIPKTNTNAHDSIRGKTFQIDYASQSRAGNAVYKSPATAKGSGLFVNVVLSTPAAAKASKPKSKPTTSKPTSKQAANKPTIGAMIIDESGTKYIVATDGKAYPVA